jgi:hypothetical protein
VKQPKNEPHLLTTPRFLHEDILCKQPCRILMSCEHRCSERCGDLCRCACNIIAPLEIVTGRFKDELWQPSLDDVLDDSPTKGWHVSQKKASHLTETPGTSVSNSTESSPRKWREWDAGKADKTLREIQAASELSAASNARPFPLIAETHREVTIKNGARVKVATANGRGPNSYRHPPPSRRQAENLKSFERGKAGSGQKSVVEKSAQLGTKFKYAGSVEVTNTPSYTLRAPPDSPLQSMSANLSATALPIRRFEQAVCTSLEIVPDWQYLEVTDQISQAATLEQIIKKPALIDIFPDPIIEFSADDEEDLISFE